MSNFFAWGHNNCDAVNVTLSVCLEEEFSTVYIFNISVNII